MAENRFVPEDLLRGMTELLKGDALVWYRSIKNYVSDLRTEILSVDYQTSLLDEIRGRL